MVDQREIGQRHRKWLLDILGKTGMTPTALARAAGLAVTTLTRPHKEPEWSRPFAAATIEKIVAATGYAPPGMAAANGFRESEPEPFEIAREDADARVRAAVDALKAGRNHVAAWEMRSRALELAGYLPGDIVICDHQREPHAGDVVCAQIYAPDGTGARTVFRIYQPPYLVAMSADRALLKPWLVDHDNVAIRGVVLEMLRADGRHAA